MCLSEEVNSIQHMSEGAWVKAHSIKRCTSMALKSTGGLKKDQVINFVKAEKRGFLT